VYSQTAGGKAERQRRRRIDGILSTTWSSLGSASGPYPVVHYRSSDRKRSLQPVRPDQGTAAWGLPADLGLGWV